MTESEILEIFRQTGALQEGHFILRSGLHSRVYFQCALALQFMPVVEQFAKALLSKIGPMEVDTVISPAMGGLVIGQEVARQLRCRFIFAEKHEGTLQLRRGFVIRPGERLLIVEDVVTLGGRVCETLQIVKNHQGVPVGIAALVDRSGGAVKFEVPFWSLLSLKVEAYDPNNLPPDLALVPAVKPGS